MFHWNRKLIAAGLKAPDIIKIRKWVVGREMQLRRGDVTVSKLVGIGLQDIAIAMYVISRQRVRRPGRSRRIFMREGIRDSPTFWRKDRPTMWFWRHRDHVRHCDCLVMPVACFLQVSLVHGASWVIIIGDAGLSKFDPYIHNGAGLMVSAIFEESYLVSEATPKYVRMV
ncbi:hypothetical protein EDD17DRAFT_1624369 [Pisolithus thermaeus]|nr:hypothetical protein EDD17DRAFT_1624369 [Pisolithus thermaeus]